MPWFKGDDQLHGAPAHNRAWSAARAALGLAYMAESYAACYGTDGFVDEAFVAQKLPDTEERAAAVEALVSNGIWTFAVDGRHGRGFEIAGWLDRNPSSDTVARRREARSEAGRRGARARWDGG